MEGKEKRTQLVSACTASYGGDGNFTGSSTASALSQQVNNPVPVLTSLTPNGATEGSSTVPVVLAGSSFLTTSVVQVNGRNVTTTYDSASQLETSLATTLLESAGTITITVVNPTPERKEDAARFGLTWDRSLAIFCSCLGVRAMLLAAASTMCSIGPWRACLYLRNPPIMRPFCACWAKPSSNSRCASWPLF
jgi:hypothetical protein